MLNLLLVVIVILILYQDIQKSLFDIANTEKIFSPVDGISYPVVSYYDDKEQAANVIAQINLFTIDLLRTLKRVYIDTNLDDFLSKRGYSEKAVKEYRKGSEITQRLLYGYNTFSLRENEPESLNKTSYTENKGQTIALCIREKESGQNRIQDIDSVKFVMLHELAHIATPEIDHSQSYWNNFRFLLEFTKKYNLYNPRDYFTNSVKYCGLHVNYTPIYDDINTTSYFDYIH